MAPKTRAFVKRAKEDTSDLEPPPKHLYDKIFLNDLLREKIIDFAIHSGDGKTVSSENARSCRLVRKEWLETVSRCLVNSGESLLQFTVMKRSDNSRSSEFLGFLDESERVLKGVPPFQLTVNFGPANFEEGRKLFESFLRSTPASKGLVDLRVSFSVGPSSSKKGRSSVFLDASQPLSLPVLRKLSLSVPTFECGGDGIRRYSKWLRLPDLEKTEIKSRRIAPAVGCILSGCKQLIDFHLDGLSPCTLRTPRLFPRSDTDQARFVLEELLPPGFENISLPATIKKLKMEQGLCAASMEQFVLNNRISNLTQLTLTIPSRFHTPHNGNDLIYLILEIHCNSLQKLEIRGDIRRARKDLEITKLRFPVMKRLASLIIRARNCEWLYGTASLERKLPAMKKMELNFATQLLLMQSTEGSRFESVEEAIFEIGPTRFNQTPDFLTLDLAREIHQAFPNVTKLTISTVWMGEMGSAFEHMFGNMTQLQVLSLNWRNNDDDCSSYLLHLYSLLVGVPPIILANLGSRVELQIQPEPFGIANLTELAQLKVTLDGFRVDRLMVGDLLFQYCLFKMPKLRKVTLPWQFEVYPGLLKRWKEEDRQILIETRGPYQDFRYVEILH